MDLDLRRLIVRHRHVAPMVSALLAGTDARVRIVGADGSLILARRLEPDEPAEQRSPITADGSTVGWVEGDRVAGSIAGVLSYAYARELDKRTLAQEALDRYRELNLIYELAAAIGSETDLTAVARIVRDEVDRLPGDESFLFVRVGDSEALTPAPGVEGTLEAVAEGEGIIGSAVDREAEIVNDVRADGRGTAGEHEFAALIVAPLRGRAGSVGVIGRVSRQAIEFRAGDLKVLAAIAALAGPAIDQARSSRAAARVGAADATG